MASRRCGNETLNEVLLEARCTACLVAFPLSVHIMTEMCGAWLSLQAMVQGPRRAQEWASHLLLPLLSLPHRTHFPEGSRGRPGRGGESRAGVGQR